MNDLDLSRAGSTVLLRNSISEAFPATPYTLFHRQFAVKRSRKVVLPIKPENTGVDLKKNGKITADPVRLVVGETHEIVSLSEAMKRARAQRLDLVEVAPNADPPVCRIMDAGAQEVARAKHVLEAREAARIKTKENKTKEVRVGCVRHRVLLKLLKSRMSNACHAKQLTHCCKTTLRTPLLHISCIVTDKGGHLNSC